MSKKYVIESWSVFEDADNLYGVEVYKPKYFSDDILKGVVDIFEFWLSEYDDHEMFSDELVMKKVMLLISDHLKTSKTKEISKQKKEIRSLLNKYLLSCKVELNRRLSLDEEITLRFVK